MSMQVEYRLRKSRQGTARRPGLASCDGHSVAAVDRAVAQLDRMVAQASGIGGQLTDLEQRLLALEAETRILLHCAEQRDCSAVLPDVAAAKAG